VRAEEAVRLDAREPPRPLSTFAGQTVHAVAGTGNPARFFAGLRSHGLTLIEHPFPDHHALTVVELAFGDELPVLMTEKDAVKCLRRADARLWYVPITAEFAPHDACTLLERVLKKLRPSAAPGGQ
jgi:tetraacyldisaccharide 4'-kinase